MSDTTQSNVNRTGILNPLSTADARNLLENIYKHTEQYHIMISGDDTLLAYDYIKDCFYKATHNDVWYKVDPIHELVDNLTSTNGKDAALSANQGRILKEWIDQHAVDFDEFKKETHSNFERVDGILTEHTSELVRIDTRLTTEVQNLSDRIAAEIEDTKQYIDAECLKLETKKANKNLDNVDNTTFRSKGVTSGLMDRLPLEKGISLNVTGTDSTESSKLALSKNSITATVEKEMTGTGNNRAIWAKYISFDKTYISSLATYNYVHNIKNLIIGQQYTAECTIRIYTNGYHIDGVSTIQLNATSNIERLQFNLKLKDISIPVDSPLYNNVNGYIDATTIEVYLLLVGSFNGNPILHSSIANPSYLTYNVNTIDSRFIMDSNGTNVQSQQVLNRGFEKGIDSKIPLTQRGVANGVATLDGEGKVPFIQIPDVVLGQNLYGGTVAANNVCTLSERFKSKYKITALTLTANNAQPYEGSYFIATGSGTIGGIANVNPGDWIISSGIATWNKIDNTDSVTSVAGRTGAVTLTKNDVGLNNVDNTADVNKRVSYANTAGSAPASDVSAWAKAANKPVYNAGEVGAMANQNNNLQTVSNANETYITYRVNGVIKGHTGSSNEMAFLHNAATNRYLKNCNDGGLRFGTGLDQTGADIYRSDFMQPILPALYDISNVSNPNKFGKNTLGCCMTHQDILGDNRFKNWIIADAYDGNDVGGATALVMGRQQNRLFLLRSNADRTVWNDAAEVWHSVNQPVSYNADAHTLVKRDGLGYINGVIFKDSFPVDAQAIGSIFYKNQVDGYHRSCTPNHLITQLGLFSNKSIEVNQISGTEHLFGVHTSRISNQGYVSRIQFVSYRPNATWATFRLKIGTNDAGTTFRTYNFDHNGNFNCEGVIGCSNVFFTSDERLKTDIIPFNNETRFKDIETYSYLKEGNTEVGYIAQQVKNIAPEYVSENIDGYLTVNYTAIHSAKIAVLENAISDILTKIKA